VLGGGAAVVAQNDKNLRAERGLSTFDQRQSFNLAFTEQSPVGKKVPLASPAPYGRAALVDPVGQHSPP